MKAKHIAGLASLAALGVHAQVGPFPAPLPLESLVVTATRSLTPTPTLRDAVVITRAELEDEGTLSLGEVLQRRAGVELRATGGPGQPESIFIRGAGAAQTLVLIDGVRVSSSTAGTTAIEAIPIDMIERIEVVKGPLSSLYGSEAAGGVIQVFTRGKGAPHFFASAGYGTDRDRRASAGLTTTDGTTLLSLSAGVRKVDAPSATNPRSPSYFPDRDPHENAFATLHASHRMWTGETLDFDVFGSRSRTAFDAGPAADGGNPNDRSDQSLGGVRFMSTTKFTQWWFSRLSVGQGRDKEVFSGLFPSRFETRKDQAAWVNELAYNGGSVLLGLETVREKVSPASTTDETGVETILFTRDHRTTNSGFASIMRTYAGQSVEASVRRDQEDQFGDRNTGSLSYGYDWASVARLSVTWARGFRAPTFNDLYGPSYPGFFVPNPNLLPEQSKSTEVSVASAPGGGVRWKLTAFDNRLEDLIVFSPSAETVLNIARAHIRGVEASLDATWASLHWHANATAQRPHDEDTGKRLQGRAERFGTVEASRAFGGAWNAGISVFASGERFDSNDESPGSRLPGYAIVDARLRYAIDKRWTAELTATNLGDKRYESAVGYDAPRRGVFLSIHFDAF